jgi:hypothetical protein
MWWCFVKTKTDFDYSMTRAKPIRVYAQELSQIIGMMFQLPDEQRL